MSTLSNTWVTSDPNVMGGTPCVKGTRITVTTVLDIIATVKPRSDIFLDYPELDEMKLRAAIEYAAKNLSPKALTASELMELKRISIIEMKKTLEKGNDERGVFIEF